jgi:prepilin-type N-terminal cleavage/methylation domain-containing protein
MAPQQRVQSIPSWPRHRHRQLHRQLHRHLNQPGAGFSLPELLLAVALLAILAAIALPSGQGALARMRVEAASRGVLLAIERERDRALRQGRPAHLAVEGAGGLLEQLAVEHGGVELWHNLPPQLRFSANGLLIDGGTVVVAAAGTPLRRCVVWSLPLGVLRLGRYGTEPGAAPKAGQCLPDPSL